MKRTTIYLTLLLSIILISCTEENKYLIQGNLKNIDDGNIIDLSIQYESMFSRIKSDTLKNGKFHFTDTINLEPIKMTISVRNHKEYSGQCQLWVGKGLIEVTGEKKYLSDWKVKSNIKEQNELNRIIDNSKNQAIQVDSLMSLIKDRKLSKKIYPIVDSILKVKYRLELEIIEKHPNSLSAIENLFFISKFDSMIPKKRINKIYKNINKNYKDNLYSEGIKAILENNTPPKIGEKLVDFSAITTNGKEHKLSEYRDKYMLLDFWSLACQPCVMSIPEMKKIQKEYINELNIIGVSMDTNKRKWIASSEKDSISWTNLWDGKGMLAGASQKYGIKGFPTYILINNKGIIIDRWIGYRKGILEKKIKKHLIKS